MEELTAWATIALVFTTICLVGVTGWLARVTRRSAEATERYVTRDKLGRITSRTETIAGETHVTAYAYDNRGRLTDVTTDGVVTEHYEYDANGNRTSATYGTETIAATTDDQDRLLTLVQRAPLPIGSRQSSLRRTDLPLPTADAAELSWSRTQGGWLGHETLPARKSHPRQAGGSRQSVPKQSHPRSVFCPRPNEWLICRGLGGGPVTHRGG